jgi:pseudouridine synthase
MTRESAGGAIRLNRYLAQAGLASRRECDTLIASGKIRVNGHRVETLGTKIDPARDRVEFAGAVVKEIQRLTYIAYHKSRGTIVTARDPQARETVYDALRKQGFEADHLRYVGRLDRNSEGLLLLTNDGELIHALTHPRFDIKKVYQVTINRPLSREDAVRMVEQGIESEGQVLRAGAIKTLPDVNAGEFRYEIDLYEGKNRQIRRMMESCNYEVIRLKRTQFANVTLRDLKRGAYRFLEEREIRGLKNKGFPANRRRTGVPTHGMVPGDGSHRRGKNR